MYPLPDGRDPGTFVTPMTGRESRPRELPVEGPTRETVHSIHRSELIIGVYGFHDTLYSVQHGKRHGPGRESR
jgi:hypothetical protein